MRTGMLTLQTWFCSTPITWRGRLMKRGLACGLLLCIGLGLGQRLPPLLARAEPNATTDTPAPRLLPVQTITVSMASSYRASRAYTGQVQARRTSILGFERAGRLVSIDVDSGARVMAGAPLATLDTQVLRTSQRELRAQLAQAHARLREMRAGPRQETLAVARANVHEQREAFRLAQQRHRRRQHLRTKGVIAQEAFDEAQSELKAGRARLDAVQRRLNELLAGTRHERIEAQEALVAQFEARPATLDLHLQTSILKAPFTGTVAARMVDDGEVVTDGQPILRLVEDSHLEVHVGVPLHAAGTLPLGSEQHVQVGQATYAARVAARLPELDATTRTVTIILALSRDLSGRLIPGQVARLALEETIATAGFWLPVSALTTGERGLWSCFVLVRDGDGETGRFRAESRAVEVLHTENARVFVRGLLQPGERVVKNGTHRLVAGQPIRPVASL